MTNNKSDDDMLALQFAAEHDVERAEALSQAARLAERNQAGSVMSSDPGPRARFAELKADPATLGIVLQMIGTGESVRQIARAWRIPRRELREWLCSEGRRLIPSPPQQMSSGLYLVSSDSKSDLI